MASDNAAAKAIAIFRSARPGDLQRVLSLLATEGLPTDGVAEGFGHGYVVAECDGQIVGAAGRERHGCFVLLRSVVVSATHRRSGIATQLVSEQLTRAKQEGAKGVYLLTTTAVEYFSKLGFRVVDRKQVPEDIRECHEYQVSCPATATVMRLGFDER